MWTEKGIIGAGREEKVGQESGRKEPSRQKGKETES